MTNTAMQNPALRFKQPDGTNFPDWETEKLVKLAIFYKGKGISKGDVLEGGKNECILYGELFTKYREDIPDIISRTNINEGFKSVKNDILFPASTTTKALDLATASVIYKDNVLLSGDINIVRPNELVNSLFLSYMVRSNLKKSIARLGQGITIVHLYNSHLQTLNIPLPHLDEQKKIAGFLSCLDTKIELLQSKHTKMLAYKKGLMQGIFSQNIRFKDKEKNFPEWEEKKLGEVAEIVGGGTPDSTAHEYWNGNIIWYTPTEIKKKYLSNSTRSITALGLQKSSAKLLPVGTLLLSSRATIGDVSIAKTECSTNQGFQNLIVNQKNHNEYWYYWLLYNKRELIRRSSGSTFLEINKTEISKILTIRPHLDEQKKIADFLSIVDEKIEKLKQKINETKAFKNGVMQQIFV